MDKIIFFSECTLSISGGCDSSLLFSLLSLVIFFRVSRLSAVSRSKKYKQLVFVFIYLYYNKIRRKVFELSKKAEKRISLLGGRSRAPLRLRLSDSMSADYSGGAGALCCASRSFAGENRHQGSARA